MKYPKLNLLFVINFLLTIVFLFTSVWLIIEINEAYSGEVDRNFELLTKNQNVSDLEKSNLIIDGIERKENFTNKLNYIFILLVIAIGLFRFIEYKTEKENKRLDILENNNKTDSK